MCLQNNRISKVRELRSTKGFDLDGTLQLIRVCFKYLGQLKEVETLRISDWIFEDQEYPDSVADCVKEVRLSRQERDRAAMATVPTSAKRE